MKTLPSHVVMHKRTPDFDQHTVPGGILGRHSTAEGVWGKIKVTEGSLTFRILEPDIEEHVLDVSRSGVVVPQDAHQIVINGPVKFHIEFYRASQH